jgi:hypothetical protein
MVATTNNLSAIAIFDMVGATRSAIVLSGLHIGVKAQTCWSIQIAGNNSDDELSRHLLGGPSLLGVTTYHPT